MRKLINAARSFPFPTSREVEHAIEYAVWFAFFAVGIYAIGVATLIRPIVEGMR